MASRVNRTREASACASTSWRCLATSRAVSAPLASSCRCARSSSASRLSISADASASSTMSTMCRGRWIFARTAANVSAGFAARRAGGFLLVVVIGFPVLGVLLHGLVDGDFDASNQVVGVRVERGAEVRDGGVLTGAVLDDVAERPLRLPLVRADLALDAVGGDLDVVGDRIRVGGQVLAAPDATPGVVPHLLAGDLHGLPNVHPQPLREDPEVVHDHGESDHVDTRHYDSLRNTLTFRPSVLPPSSWNVATRRAPARHPWHLLIDAS